MVTLPEFLSQIREMPVDRSNIHAFEWPEWTESFVCQRHPCCLLYLRQPAFAAALTKRTHHVPVFLYDFRKKSILIGTGSNLHSFNVSPVTHSFIPHSFLPYRHLYDPYHILSLRIRLSSYLGHIISQISSTFLSHTHGRSDVSAAHGAVSSSLETRCC